MESELPLIPTVEQRRAVVTEVTQGVARAAGEVLSSGETGDGAWQDLWEWPERRNAAVGAMIKSMEGAGRLAAKVGVGETTVASTNIRELLF